RQSQQLVLTPQLTRAIKLLQLSNLELEAYIAEEISKNPLLEARSDEPEEQPAGDFMSDEDSPDEAPDAPGAARARRLQVRRGFARRSPGRPGGRRPHHRRRRR